MAATPSLAGGDRNHWWLTNRKIAGKYLKDARILIASQEQSAISSALNLLDAALSLSPRLEPALELKARTLLFLRRYRDIADMLQDSIPSLKIADSDESSSSLSSDSSSQQLLKEHVKVLERENPSFKCFSVSDLKKKVMAGLCKNCDKEGQWRYLVLGQACCHLGLMDDALLLLQTGKRLAAAALCRKSTSLSDDSFSFSQFPVSGDISPLPNQPPVPPKSEIENISHMVSHMKLLLRRKTAALAAFDVGLYPESIRHFSKILESRRGGPQAFLAECYVYRALAYKTFYRIAEAIADCNRALALDPSSIEALSIRATLFESIRCLPGSLHDLEHLKLLYNSILRDRKLPGPAWKRPNLNYREISGKLCELTVKIQELKQSVSKGETGHVDYYALIGLRRGCSRSELGRAHLLLTLRHKPDRANGFIDRCEFADERDVDSIRERAKLSALVLYRLIQKGYTSLMAIIMEEEAVEKQRNKAKAALQAVMEAQQITHEKETNSGIKGIENNMSATKTADLSVYQGVFCKDIAAVGNLLSQVGFNRPIQVKYEALSC